MKNEAGTSKLVFTFLALVAVSVAVGLNGVRTEAAELEMVDVFTSGVDGYHTYRIPSLICTPKGTLLAFCEGRKFNGIDESPTDMVLKRSLDGGKTWLPMQVVVKAVPEPAMDPTSVIDHTTGTIVLVYDLWPEYIKDTWPADYKIASGLGRNSVTAWVTTSSDEGATWSTPVDITATTKKPEWAQIGHGPGVGIQTRSGRLVIPSFFWAASNDGLGATAPYSTAIYSDDHGKTWQLSDNKLGPGVNEVQVVELTDGTLVLNMRRGGYCRVGATSKDGGKTWSKMFDIPELPEPDCQGSILRYTCADQQGKSRILFCNPGVTSGDKITRGRHTGTVRLSYDEGKTWPVAKALNSNKGFFGYSCLTSMPDGSIGCLFEGAGSEKSAIPSKGFDPEKYHATFVRFSLEWLTDGKDSLKR